MKAIWNNKTLAQSDSTIVVENNHYFPPDSIHSAFFKKSPTETHCAWKGVANYYTTVAGDKENIDAAWYYSDPLSAAKNIRGYVAFWKGVVVI